MKDKNQNQIEVYNEQRMDIAKIISDCNVDAFEEAIYICDISDIIEKFYGWKRRLPRVIPFYAVKCNDHPLILKTLSELGTGFDCASRGEIQKVLDIGVEPERIIFANPTKPNSHLTYAMEAGVNVMTFDNDFELYKVQKFHSQADLVIRIRCDAEKAQCPLGMKFGCDAEEDAPRLISLAKALGLKIIGVSFHVGSGCMDFPVYRRAIAAAKKLFNYGQTLGFKFKLLDIGGGFPGNKGTTLDEVANIINKALDDFFPESDILVISEPGRYFVSSAFTLICKIHSKREIVLKDKIEDIMYFINDGVYGSFNCILYDHHVAAPQYLLKTVDKFYKSSVWGPTCDGLDQICSNVLLPKLDIGDILLFENMGAYTLPIASPFNGFPLPRVKFYIHEKDEYISSVI